MNIGIIGQGFVGSAVYEGMKNYFETFKKNHSEANQEFLITDDNHGVDSNLVPLIQVVICVLSFLNLVAQNLVL
jgi:homoserine dehydrogenase